MNRKGTVNSSSSFEKSRKEAIEEVHVIYRELENRPIERGCNRLTECCQFKLTGRTPQLTRGETLLAVQAFRASGRKELPPSREGACPLLHEKGTCMIYQNRPFGCRTHFCSAAGGPYARNEVLDLIRRLETIDVRLGGNGPHALPDAMKSELESQT